MVVLRRLMRRLVRPIAQRWYDWLFGANGVAGGDGRGVKSLVILGFNDFDPGQSQRRPLVCLQVGLAVVPGPRIVARTFLSPADADEFLRAGLEALEKQTSDFGDVEPRRFDTSQLEVDHHGDEFQH